MEVTTAVTANRDSTDTTTMRFKIVADTISDFTVSGGLLGGLLVFFNPGSGIVINDLSMEISFVTSTSPSVTYEMQLIRTFKD